MKSRYKYMSNEFKIYIVLCSSSESNSCLLIFQTILNDLFCSNNSDKYSLHRLILFSNFSIISQRKKKGEKI
jgi:hypothetical protein